MEPQQLYLTVTGMTCGACANTVERKVQDREGTLQADINYATETLS